MYNTKLKTLQLGVSAYLKGKFKHSSPFIHSMIKTSIYCTPRVILVGVFLFIYYIAITFLICYFGCECVICIYF